MTLLITLALASSFATLAHAQVSMVHNDLAGTGSFTSESALTPSKVASGKFGVLGSYALDGAMWGQPLIASGVTVSGKTYDLLIAETVNNSLYAFNAKAPGSPFLWKTSIGSPNTSYAGYGTANSFYGLAFGCWSTPVIDSVNGVLYIVCGLSNQTWKLYKISLADGSTSASVVISGSVTGTGDPMGGDCVSGGVLSFCPAVEFQRPGLKLSGGIVYVTFGSIADQRPWHGWIMAYNSSLTQTAIFCTTPNGWGGAIWGGEPTIDGSGNLYITTGNGSDQAAGLWTDSVLKMSSSLSLLGSWTPSNAATINAADADTSSNRLILIPGTHLLAATGAKDFNVYVLDAGCLSGGSGTTCQTQTFKTDSGGVISSSSGAYGALFMNNVLYLPTSAGKLYAFTWNVSSFTTTPLWSGATYGGFPGPTGLSGSCNGASSNCILWMVMSAGNAATTPTAGTLRALNPTTGTELWNSGSTLGNLSKFSAPTIYKGSVFVATQSSVVVYGSAGNANLNGQATLTGVTSLQ